MILYLYRAISILIAMVLHEWAHGIVSYKLGDPTPKSDGRLTLNPIKHVDPIGAILLLICGFGWAKPVRVNYNYYKNPKQGMAMTAAAGPLMNLLIACIGIFLTKHILPNNLFLQVFVSINLVLCVFNLIPFPPLDGSKILAAFLSDNIYDKYMMLERYSMFILIGLMMLGAFHGVLSTVVPNLSTLLYSIL